MKWKRKKEKTLDENTGYKEAGKKNIISTLLIEIWINMVYNKERMKSPNINLAIITVWKGNNILYLIVTVTLEGYSLYSNDFGTIWTMPI